jgi:hypothetical protein
MKFLILIHQNKGAREQFAGFPPEVRAAAMQGYWDLNADLQASGEYISAEALADDTTSTVLRMHDGAVSTTDGPFAESKELLAGFYLVDVASRERAVEIGTRIPEVQAGAALVEVRPVLDYSAEG